MLIYYPPDENNPNGHYVPEGMDRNWSSGKDDNNCFFDAIAYQTGDDAAELRRRTIDRIDSNPTRYISRYLHEDDEFNDVFVKGGNYL